MKRSYLIGLLIILVVAVTFFPTPHLHTKQDLVKTLDCSTTLEDGDSISQNWVDMQDQTKIIIDVQSTESVDVALTNGTTIIYSQSGTVHAYTDTHSETAFTVSVTNPTIFGTGPAANMTGSIEGYHLCEVQEWLPWWMP